MNSGRDPFDWLRRHAQSPTPSPEDVVKARTRLERAIAAELEAAALKEKTRHFAIWGVAAAVLAVVLVALPVMTRDPAQAALIEIARAAREATPLDVPSGDFILNESERLDLAVRPGADVGLSNEFIAYQLPTTRKVWRNPQQGFFQVQTTVEDPIFFDPIVESAYYSAGINEADQVGETIVEQYTDVTDPLIETNWPTKADDLLEEMEAFLGNGQPSTPAEILDLATDLLRETNPTPQLRGAVLEVIAQLPLDFERQGSQSITISVIEGGRQTTVTLSRTGELITETVVVLNGDPELGIPPGTVVEKVQHQPTRLVDDLPG